VRTGIRFILVCALVYSCSLWLIVMLLPGALFRSSTRSPSAPVGIPSLRIYFCGLHVHVHADGRADGVRRARQGEVRRTFSLLRKVLIVVPLVFLLPMIPALGVNGVSGASRSPTARRGGLLYAMYFTVYRSSTREARLQAGIEVLSG
jgi:Na+-driven multidrug efflux pump